MNKQQKFFQGSLQSLKKYLKEKNTTQSAKMSPIL